MGRLQLQLILLLGSLSILAVAQSAPFKLEFREMLLQTPKGLTPSPRLRQLDGKRVKIEGFMAMQENASTGGFWLCPTPIFQDESGAGTGDLPPNAVFVQVRGAGSKPVSYLRGKLSVTGKFHLKGAHPRLVLLLDSMPPKKKS